MFRRQFTAHETDFETLLVVPRQNGIIDVKDHLAKVQPYVSSAFKLDRIKLQLFSRVLSDWQSFKDLFESSVNRNTTLSGTEKMVHLKSSLTGEAAALLSSFQVTDANYKLAWDAVVHRNNRERSERLYTLTSVSSMSTKPCQLNPQKISCH